MRLQASQNEGKLGGLGAGGLRQKKETLPINRDPLGGTCKYGEVTTSKECPPLETSCGGEKGRIDVRGCGDIYITTRNETAALG